MVAAVLALAGARKRGSARPAARGCPSAPPELGCSRVGVGGGGGAVWPRLWLGGKVSPPCDRLPLLLLLLLLLLIVGVVLVVVVLMCQLLLLL